MSGIPSEVPQPEAGTYPAGQREPDSEPGPGAGDQAQPVIGTPGATAEEARTAGTHDRRGYRIVPDDEG